MVQAARRKYHYIYKITRIDTGRFYIGMHSSDNIDDGYFGSGKLITASIKKHGKEKHTKEILEFLPSREVLHSRERELVNEDLLGNRLCMNLKLGGVGNAPGDIKMIEAVRAAHSTPEAKARASKNTKRLWQDPVYRANISSYAAEHNEKRWAVDGAKEAAAEIQKNKWTDPEYRKAQGEKISIGSKGRPSIWDGRKHSEETKAKMSAAKIGRPNARSGIKHTEEAKAKMRGRVRSEETLAKVVGQKRTPEQRAKMSAAQLGKPSPAKGLGRSDEFKEKMRLSWVIRKAKKESEIVC